MSLKYSSLLLGIDKTNWMYSNYDHGIVYQICKFNDPMVLSFIVFLHWTCIRCAKYIVVMSKEGSSKIVNFRSPEQGFSCKSMAKYVIHVVFLHWACICSKCQLHFIIFSNSTKLKPLDKKNPRAPR